MGQGSETRGGKISRRQVVRCGGVLIASTLAGCSGLIGSGTDQQAVDSVSFNQGQLIVHLNSDTDTEVIEFRTPNGQLLTTAQVGRKQQLSIPLLIETNSPLDAMKPLSAGDYTLTATKSSDGDDNSETISEQIVELTSSFTISDVSIIEDNSPSDFAQNPPSYAEDLRVTIENTGNLPLGVIYIGVIDGVPSPMRTSQELQGSMTPDGFEPASGGGMGPYYINGQSTRAFETTTGPLSYYSYWQSPQGDEPGPRTWGAPEKGTDWENITSNYCKGEQHSATIDIAPMNLQPQQTTVTLNWDGEATRRQRLDTDYACTNVSVVNISKQNSSS